MTELPDEIFRKWLHSFEEDRGDIIAYRPTNFQFPPARGRDGIEFRRDGEFIDWRIPPADGPLLLEIIRCDEEKLEVQQQPDSPVEPNIHANLYELTGENTQISYITDPPQLHYQGPGIASNHDQIFSGDEAALRQSEIGRLVVVTLEVVPDLHTLTLAVLVPPVNLRADTAEQTGEVLELPINTLAILTTFHTTIGGPALVSGALETHRVVTLQGMARRVEHPRV